MRALCATSPRRGWAAWNVEYRRLGGYGRRLAGDVRRRRGGDRPPRPAGDHARPLRASSRSATRPAGSWRCGARRRDAPRVRVTARPQAGVSDLRPRRTLGLGAAPCRVSSAARAALRGDTRRLAGRAAAARRAAAADPRRPRRHRATLDERALPAAAARRGTRSTSWSSRARATSGISSRRPAWRARDRMARGEPRGDAAAARRRRPARAASASASCIGDGDDLPRRQLARPPAASRRASGLAALIDGVGRAARRRLAGMDRRCRPASATCSRPVLGARPGRGRRLRLDDREPVQARGRGARRARRRGGARHRRAATSPPTATCSRGSPRQRGLELRRFDRRAARPRRCRAGDVALVVPLARRLPHGRARRPAGDHGRGARARRAAALGPQPLGRRRPGRTCATPAPTWRWAAPTSTSTPARARPAYLYVRGDAADRAALADLGLVRPARAVRDGPALRPRARTSRGSWPARRRSSGSRRSRRACALIAEAGIGALRAKAIALTELAVALHDAWLAPLGFELGEPARPAAARLARRAAPPGRLADHAAR